MVNKNKDSYELPIIEIPTFRVNTKGMDCIQASYHRVKGTGRIFPELLASDLVGVQPMTGPSSHTFAMKMRSTNGTVAK